MKLVDKIRQLQDVAFHQWSATRRTVEDELSDKQSMFCVCGRLATGLHERSCRRFRLKVDAETVKRLEHLLRSPETRQMDIGRKPN